MFLPAIETNQCNSNEVCVDVFEDNHQFIIARCVSKERYVRIAYVMLARSARARSRTGTGLEAAAEPSGAT